jgi:two-component system response regulator FixJ
MSGRTRGVAGAAAIPGRGYWSSPLHRLTSREAAVLALIVEGSTNREIAAALGISSRTVEFHRANVMGKLRARNVVELMQVVLRQDQPAGANPAARTQRQPET